MIRIATATVVFFLLCGLTCYSSNSKKSKSPANSNFMDAFYYPALKTKIKISRGTVFTPKNTKLVKLKWDKVETGTVLGKFGIINNKAICDLDENYVVKVWNIDSPPGGIRSMSKSREIEQYLKR